ncbi:MAG: TonB-dependent receptor [Paludibacteraceae bacterium]|nr:TonB-dependent receptor [Paludibacteraceae bacterium]
MTRQTRRFLSAGICLWCVCLCVWSQEETDTLAVHEIEEFCFTGSRLKSEMVPFQRMDSAVLRNLSCQSVADAIRYFSGVQMKDYGGVGGVKTINIRSMGTNQMGVFYDGIQLGNAQNGQVDLGRFSLDNIEMIDLYNGQKTSDLQSAKDYGAAGTVYIETRVPKFAEGKKDQLDMKFKTGSFGLANPSVTYNRQIDSTLMMSVSAEYTYATGRYKFTYRKVDATGAMAYDTTAVRENADIQAVRAEMALFGDKGKETWKVRLYNYYSDRGLPGYVARNLFSHSQRQWDDNFFAQGSYKNRFWNDRVGLMVNAKYAYDYTHYLNPDTTLQYIDNRYRQQEAYLSVAGSMRIYDWWTVSLSTDVQCNALDADLQAFAYPFRTTGLVALATKFKHPNVQFQASVLGTFVHDKVSDGMVMQPYSQCSPAAYLSVRPWRNVLFDIRAFYKRIFRMPTFNDLYYTDIGNARLDPEFVNQYNVGLGYRFAHPDKTVSDFGVQVDAYHNDVENKIVAMPSSNAFRWQMKNYGRVRIDGVDASVDVGFKWCKHWALGLRLAYTYQQAADLSYDSSSPYYGGQLPYIPWHSGSVVSDVSYRNWTLNYSFIYTGERYASSANIPVNYVQPWYTHDLSLSYLHNFQNWKLKGSIQVNNLFNQQYEVVVGYPMPGTNFRLVISALLN